MKNGDNSDRLITDHVGNTNKNEKVSTINSKSKFKSLL